MKSKRVLVRLFITGLLLYCIQLQADTKKMAAEIDSVIKTKLESIKQNPRAEVDDYTFARRAYIDLSGRIPTYFELTEFISSKSKNKRAELIQALLKSKGFNSHFYNYWADLLRVKSLGDKLHHAGNFREWIKDAVRTNKSYSQIVRELVSAKGELYKPGNGAVGYYAREPMQLDHLANTVKSFLAIGVECAQCHDHPFDDWTQKDFYQLAAFTAKTYLRVDPLPQIEKKEFSSHRKRLKKKGFDPWIVYRESIRMKFAAVHGSGTGYMRLPHDYKYDDGKPHDLMQAKSLFGSTPTMNFKMPKKAINKRGEKFFGPEINSKEALAEWMTSKSNPMFTKATVNRLWHKIMGTELIGPIANLELGAEGSHPKLTKVLVRQMKELNFDIRKFLQVLLNTKTYQSKALRPDTAEYMLDGPVIRRLPAEVMWDSILSLATPTPDKFVPTKYRYDGFTNFYEKSQKMTADDFAAYAENLKKGRGAFYQHEHKLAAKRNSEPLGPQQLRRISELDSYRTHPVTLMGKSNRELIDNANQEPNIPQVLFLLNGSLENSLIRSNGNYLKKLLAKLKPEEQLDVLWVAFLGRPPADRERKLIPVGEVSKSVDDIMWSLLNSNEFRFTR